MRSDNDADQDLTGTYNIAHIQKGLGPLADCHADPACVPLNLFGGPGTITPEMLKYMQYHEHDTSHQSLGVITANISGDLLQLPAGSLDFATGYEHRNLSGNYQPDAIVVAGESNGVPSQPTGTATKDEVPPSNGRERVRRKCRSIFRRVPWMAGMPEIQEQLPALARDRFKEPRHSRESGNPCCSS